MARTAFLRIAVLLALALAAAVLFPAPAWADP